MNRCATIALVRSEKPRVLIIDDEILIGRMVQRILRDADVVVMTSARDAFDVLKGPERFDLVLCDVMMPDMTGMELHAVIRRDAPELLEGMYFMTGGAFTPSAQAFLETIGTARLDKPLGSAALRALLAKHATSELSS